MCYHELVIVYFIKEITTNSFILYNLRIKFI
jgi:hypothetical protein